MTVKSVKMTPSLAVSTTTTQRVTETLQLEGVDRWFYCWKHVVVHRRYRNKIKEGEQWTIVDTIRLDSRQFTGVHLKGTWHGILLLLPMVYYQSGLDCSPSGKVPKSSRNIFFWSTLYQSGSDIAVISALLGLSSPERNTTQKEGKLKIEWDHKILQLPNKKFSKV